MHTALKSEGPRSLGSRGSCGSHGSRGYLRICEKNAFQLKRNPFRGTPLKNMALCSCAKHFMQFPMNTGSLPDKIVLLDPSKQCAMTHIQNVREE